MTGLFLFQADHRSLCPLLHLQWDEPSISVSESAPGPGLKSLVPVQLAVIASDVVITPRYKNEVWRIATWRSNGVSAEIASTGRITL